MAAELACERFNREDAVTAYVAGRLDETAAAEFEEHYFSCDACAEAVRRAQALRDAFAAGATRPAAPQRLFAGRLGLAAAASLLFAAVGSFLWMRPASVPAEPPVTPAPVLRSSQGELVVSARRSPEGIKIECSPRERAAHYTFEVEDANGLPLLSRSVPAARLVLAESDLPPGRMRLALTVRVRAVDVVGYVLADSEPVVVPAMEPGR